MVAQKKQRKTRKLTTRKEGNNLPLLKSEKPAGFFVQLLGATLCINRLHYKRVLENLHKIYGFYSAYMVRCAIWYNLRNLKKNTRCSSMGVFHVF